MIRLILPKYRLDLHTSKKLFLSLAVRKLEDPQDPVTLIIGQVEVGPPVFSLGYLVQFALVLDCLTESNLTMLTSTDR